MVVKEAIILAGGKGTRLRSVTQNKFPKSLTKIKEKPIVEWEIEWLAREGVSHVILAVGHLSEIIRDHFQGNYSSNYGNIEITISEEKEKLGSGGAFKLASNYISTEKCYAINGDILTNASLKELNLIHEEKNVLASMLLVNLRSQYGIVKHQNNIITDFVEKPILDIQIHAGVDIIEQVIFDRFPLKGQMEDTIFTQLTGERKFASFLLPNDIFWMSIDTEKDFIKANGEWSGL